MTYDPYWNQHLAKTGAYYIQVVDEFTDKPISRQRKWQLRDKEHYDKVNSKYAKSPRGLELHRIRNKQWRERNIERLRWQQTEYYKTGIWPPKDTYVPTHR